jgi:hypothetical protein
MKSMDIAAGNRDPAYAYVHDFLVAALACADELDPLRTRFPQHHGFEGVSSSGKRR